MGFGVVVEEWTENTNLWSHGGLRECTSPLFENMSLVIRPNLHRNSEVAWGGKGLF